MMIIKYLEKDKKRFTAFMELREDRQKRVTCSIILLTLSYRSDSWVWSVVFKRITDMLINNQLKEDHNEVAQW